MSKELVKLTGNILEESVFLKGVELLTNHQFKSRLFKDAVRKLSVDEIEQLRNQGNVCDDWNAILVADGFTGAGIFHNVFHGKCCLGKFNVKSAQKNESFGLPAGIYRSTIINSEIGSDCVIYDTGVVSNCVVNEGAILLKNGSISASSSCTFGNGIEIAVGNETGGREILSYADLTIPVAEAVAKKRSDKNFLNEYKLFVERYLARCTAPAGYVGKNAIIRNTNTIEDVYAGDDVVVTGASLIKNCTLLATPEERTEISHGAYVKDACVQWGCEITSMAVVDKSVICEHAHVERHGKVTSSIIGPNTGIAEGEVTSCLVGPFVGFHHQSMLIAALWPEGKGNVAYGANIGSNHTSKSPDQEILCGEGMFFGLGANIKFPSDFTSAPYSIIAAGVDTLPQKIEFPFSLINKPVTQASGISPSFNEIFPGWVLYQNIYSVRRNEGKYRKRNKARRSDISFTVFRPDIINMMISAGDALKNIGTADEIYVSRDIPGIGKNFLSEQSRKNGIDAYELYIEYYALTQMLNRITAVLAKGGLKDIDGIYDDKTDDHDWEHARNIINERYRVKSPGDNLSRLIEILNIISDSTYRSKKRDDDRGIKIIPDYAAVNILADDDSFVKETIKETTDQTGRIENIIKQM